MGCGTRHQYPLIAAEKRRHAVYLLCQSMVYRTRPWRTLGAKLTVPVELTQAMQAAVKSKLVTTGPQEKTSVTKPAEITVSTEPAELIQIDGDPQFMPIDGTQLSYVVNTPSACLSMPSKITAGMCWCLAAGSVPIPPTAHGSMLPVALCPQTLAISLPTAQKARYWPRSQERRRLARR